MSSDWEHAGGDAGEDVDAYARMWEGDNDWNFDDLPGNEEIPGDWYVTSVGYRLG